jgi:SulP family sulfate permease
VIAGLVAGLFSIPEGMAYAKLGGFNPVLGLYAGIVPTIAGSLSSSTQLMLITLTSAIALSSSSALEQAGLEPTNGTAVFTLTCLVGAIMAVAGLLRLGSLTGFVSNAVMTGFVTGIAVAIIEGELGDFSGYKPVGPNKLAKIFNWLVNVDQWVPVTVGVGVLTVVLALVFKRIKRTENYSTIIVLVLVTAIVAVLKLPVDLVGDIASIPRSLPGLALPDVTLMPGLAVGALSVALVALAQAAGIGAAVPNPDGSRSSTSRDFVGQGLANLFGGLFQALPAGGSLSRTGVGTGAGAKSRWTGVFAGIWLAVIVVTIGPLAELIPMAVIGGLLFVVAGEIIVGKIPDIRLTAQASISSILALVATFLLTMFVPLQWAILAGALLSLLLFVGQAAGRVRLIHLVRDEQDRWAEQATPTSLPSHQVVALYYEGTSFFAEVPHLQQLLPDARDATGSVVLLGLRGTTSASSTFLKWLEKYTRQLHANGNRLMLFGVEPKLMAVLERSGLVAMLGQECIFPAEPAIFGPMEAAEAAAQAWIARGAQ